MNTADILALIIGGTIAVIAVAYLMINQKKKVSNSRSQRPRSSSEKKRVS